MLKARLNLVSVLSRTARTTAVLSLLAGAASVVAPQVAHATKPAPELSAQQIVDQALSQGIVGFEQGTATMRMVITNARGEVKDRTLAVKARKTKAGEFNFLVKFEKPAEVAGIAFLVKEKKAALPDQYVYIPAAKTVRQVAAGSANASFFGSDLTYADLMPLPVDEKGNVQMKRLPDAKVGGIPVYVIEVLPKVQGSPYGKVVVHVHQKAMMPLKVEYFDPDMKALKTLSMKKLKKQDGRLVPVKLQMKNVQKGSKTVLTLMNVDQKAKLSDADFTQEAMQR